jgi:hypothetical protein
MQAPLNSHSARTQEWPSRHEKLIPESYTGDEVKSFKSKVDDLAGSIPLLLEECVMNG